MPTNPHTDGPASPSRRRTLGLLGAATAALLTSCVPSPVVTGGQSPRRAIPAPTLDAQHATALQVELACAHLATAVAQRSPGWHAPDAVAGWAEAVAAMHHAHATVLGQADPLGGVNTDHSPITAVAALAAAASTSVTGVSAAPDLASGLKLLATAESQLADASQSDALGADASWALLWTALSTAARGVTFALQASPDGTALGPGPVRGTAVPARVDVSSRTTALQTALSHTDALVFGLETVIGRQNSSNPTLMARLKQVRLDRDHIAGLLTHSGSTPAPPAPEYRFAHDIGDLSRADTILGGLELNVLSAWGTVAAASTRTDRVEALHAIQDQLAPVRSHNVALPWWPGWV